MILTIVVVRKSALYIWLSLIRIRIGYLRDFLCYKFIWTDITSELVYVLYLMWIFQLVWSIRDYQNDFLLILCEFHIFQLWTCFLTLRIFISRLVCDNCDTRFVVSFNKSLLTLCSATLYRSTYRLVKKPFPQVIQSDSVCRFSKPLFPGQWTVSLVAKCRKHSTCIDVRRSSSLVNTTRTIKYDLQ